MPSDYMPTWTPLKRLGPDEINPEMDAIYKRMGLPPSDETWWSPQYQAVVRYAQSAEEDAPQGREGLLHVSIHRHDRSPMRNWRHLQQIKNEIAGEDRWGVEVFPPESYLVDSANEYHLYVMPVNADIPFAFHESIVSSDEQVEAYNEQRGHKGRQEPWEPGLTTGRNENTPGPDERLDEVSKG